MTTSCRARFRPQSTACLTLCLVLELFSLHRRFRVAAVNAAGVSSFSEASNGVTTLAQSEGTVVVDACLQPQRDSCWRR